MFNDELYECIPPEGYCPPKLYKYPGITSPVKLLFLGWNPPKPFGGFWSDDNDNLRRELRGILKDKELGQIDASSPDKDFLDEFLKKGFYFVHTVKCWTEAKFPRLGRGSEGEELINSCVHTHLDKELTDLAPQKVCALGEVPFLGLCELFPGLTKTKTTPTQGQVFQREKYGIPWPLLYTCFPQPRPVLIRGTNCRKPARAIVLGHLRHFLQSH